MGGGVIGDVVRLFIERREMLGMSQREVADRMGVHKSTVSAAERGYVNPEWTFLVKWARALRMDVRMGVFLNCKEWTEPYFGDLTPEVP